MLFWRGVAQEQRAAHPFKRLRRSLGLLLQVLALAAIEVQLLGQHQPLAAFAGLAVVIRFVGIALERLPQGAGVALGRPLPAVAGRYIETVRGVGYRFADSPT